VELAIAGFPEMPDFPDEDEDKVESEGDSEANGHNPHSQPKI